MLEPSEEMGIEEDRKCIIKEKLTQIIQQNFNQIKSLDENSRNMIITICQQAIQELSLQFFTLEQQLQKVQKQNHDLFEQFQQCDKLKDDYFQEMERLNSELEQQINRQNEMEQEIVSIKQQLYQQKGLIVELENEKNEQEERLIQFQLKISNQEAEKEAMSNQLHKQKYKMKDLEESIEFLQIKMRQTQRLYQFQQQKTYQLSSSISQKEGMIKELNSIIQENDYIKSLSSKQNFKHIKGRSDQNTSFQNRKYLNEEEPNIRLSQSQDPIFSSEQGFKSAQKKMSTNIKPKKVDKPDLASERKVPKKTVSKASLGDKKQFSTSSLRQEKSEKNIKTKMKDQNIKEKIKEIFTDRVKYKIQNDLKYHHKFDSLVCKLRSKEIENEKLNEELNYFKKEKKCHERISSLVLPKNSKSARKTTSKLEPNEKWLESDMRQDNLSENPMQNTSYQELSQRNSEEQTSPQRIVDNLEEFEASLKGQSRVNKKDFSDEFTLTQNKIQHHLLNLEIDCRDDMSFKNIEANNSESYSLLKQNIQSKRKRFLSSNSNHDSELYMYQGSLVKDCKNQISSVECSPAILRVPVQMQTSKEQSLSLISNKDVSLQICPPDKNDSEHILVTSYLETSRRSCSSISEFQMIFQQKRKSLEFINLGCLTSVNPITKKLQIEQVLCEYQKPTVKKYSHDSRVIEYTKEGKKYSDMQVGTQVIELIHKQIDTTFDTSEIEINTQLSVQIDDVVIVKPRMVDFGSNTENTLKTKDFEIQTIQVTFTSREVQTDKIEFIDFSMDCSELQNRIQIQEQTNTQIKTYCDSCTQMYEKIVIQTSIETQKICLLSTSTNTDIQEFINTCTQMQPKQSAQVQTETDKLCKEQKQTNTDIKTYSNGFTEMEQNVFVEQSTETQIDEKQLHEECLKQFVDKYTSMEEKSVQSIQISTLQMIKQERQVNTDIKSFSNSFTSMEPKILTETEISTENIEKKDTQTSTQTKFYVEVDVQTQTIENKDEETCTQNKSYVDAHTDIQKKIFCQISTSTDTLCKKDAETEMEYKEFSDVCTITEEIKKQMTDSQIQTQLKETRVEKFISNKAFSYKIMQQTKVSVQKEKKEVKSSQTDELILKDANYGYDKKQYSVDSFLNYSYVPSKKDSLLEIVQMYSQTINHSSKRDQDVNTEIQQMKSVCVQQQEQRKQFKLESMFSEVIEPQRKTKNFTIIPHECSITIVSYEDQQHFLQSSKSSQEQWYSIYSSDNEIDSIDEFQYKSMTKSNHIPEIQLKNAMMETQMRHIQGLNTARTRSSSQQALTFRSNIEQIISIVEQNSNQTSKYSPKHSEKISNSDELSLIESDQNNDESSSIFNEQISPIDKKNARNAQQSNQKIQKDHKKGIECSQFETLQISEDTLPHQKYFLSEDEWDTVKRLFFQIKSYKLVSNHNLTTDQEQTLPFNLCNMQIYYCHNRQKHAKVIIWRKKVILLSQKVYRMQLNPLNLSSIIYQNGNLLMGNSELTIINQRLSIKNRNKIRFFKGYVPDGEWYVSHAQVFQIK